MQNSVEETPKSTSLNPPPIQDSILSKDDAFESEMLSASEDDNFPLIYKSNDTITFVHTMSKERFRKVATALLREMDKEDEYRLKKEKDAECSNNSLPSSSKSADNAETGKNAVLFTGTPKKINSEKNGENHGDSRNLVKQERLESCDLNTSLQHRVDRKIECLRNEDLNRSFHKLTLASPSCGVDYKRKSNLRMSLPARTSKEAFLEKIARETDTDNSGEIHSSFQEDGRNFQSSLDDHSIENDKQSSGRQNSNSGETEKGSLKVGETVEKSAPSEIHAPILSVSEEEKKPSLISEDTDKCSTSKDIEMAETAKEYYSKAREFWLNSDSLNKSMDSTESEESQKMPKDKETGETENKTNDVFVTEAGQVESVEISRLEENLEELPSKSHPDHSGVETSEELHVSEENDSQITKDEGDDQTENLDVNESAGLISTADVTSFKEASENMTSSPNVACPKSPIQNSSEKGNGQCFENSSHADSESNPSDEIVTEDDAKESMASSPNVACPKSPLQILSEKSNESCFQDSGHADSESNPPDEIVTEDDAKESMASSPNVACPKSPLQILSEKGNESCFEDSGRVESENNPPDEAVTEDNAKESMASSPNVACLKIPLQILSEKSNESCFEDSGRADSESNPPDEIVIEDNAKENMASSPNVALQILSEKSNESCFEDSGRADSESKPPDETVTEDVEECFLESTVIEVNVDQSTEEATTNFGELPEKFTESKAVKNSSVVLTEISQTTNNSQKYGKRIQNENRCFESMIEVNSDQSAEEAAINAEGLPEKLETLKIASYEEVVQSSSDVCENEEYCEGVDDESSHLEDDAVDINADISTEETSTNFEKQPEDFSESEDKNTSITLPEKSETLKNSSSEVIERETLSEVCGNGEYSGGVEENSFLGGAESEIPDSFKEVNAANGLEQKTVSEKENCFSDELTAKNEGSVSKAVLENGKSVLPDTLKETFGAGPLKELKSTADIVLKNPTLNTTESAATEEPVRNGCKQKSTEDYKESDLPDSESADDGDKNCNNGGQAFIAESDDCRSVEGSLESEDSQESEMETSKLSAKNKRSKKLDEVDAAPTRRRRIGLDLSQQVIPEDGILTKSAKSFGSRSSNANGSKSAVSEKKSSLTPRTLRSKSLDPSPQKSITPLKEVKSKILTTQTDSNISTRLRRAKTPEVKLKSDIKVPVRQSPRKLVRAATSNSAESSKTAATRSSATSKASSYPTRSNTEDSGTSSASARRTKRGA